MRENKLMVERHVEEIGKGKGKETTKAATMLFDQCDAEGKTSVSNDNMRRHTGRYNHGKWKRKTALSCVGSNAKS